MKNKISYFDYAATTPVDPRVAKKMQSYLEFDGVFGNPESLHSFGKQAKEAIEIARVQVSGLIQASPEEIIFTSGATEANNLALKGAALLYQNKGKHIVTMRTEHKTVLDVCFYLEKMGFQVTYLDPNPNGLLDFDAFKKALRADTILVSIMHVNNETGVIQDLARIAAITSAQNILLHVDAVQSAGKIPIDVQTIPINLLSLTAHKVYGPKGIGALYLRKKPRIRVMPMLHGGGHEQGMRSGTLPTHQIVGMGEAFEIARCEMNSDTKRITHYRNQLIEYFKSIKNIVFNSPSDIGVPHILNIQFEGMLADALLSEWHTLALSKSSACQSKSDSTSHVLRAMGLSQDAVNSSMRFSLGRFISQEDIQRALSVMNF